MYVEGVCLVSVSLGDFGCIWEIFETLGDRCSRDMGIKFT